MKTVEQLLEKFAEDHTEIDNVMCFCYNDLLQFVPFKTVYPYLKDKVTPAEWAAYYMPLTAHNVKRAIKQYMAFALDKAINERGISAQRNLAHFKVWLWILDETRLIRFLDDPRNYPCFGFPVLLQICKRFKWPFKNFVKPNHRDIVRRFARGEGC